MWVLYGWFSGLMCLGSVFGAVTWVFWMQTLVAFFTGSTPGLPPAQVQSLLAQAAAQYWAAAFLVTYAIEFLCLSVAKLLVLYRMADFAVAKGDGLSRCLAVGGRSMMAAVVVGNVAGLCGNVAAAVLHKQAGDLYNADAAAVAANSTEAAYATVQANQKNSVATDTGSVQQFCEVAVLLMIILAFAVVGIASAHRVSSAQSDLSGQLAAAGRQPQRQIVGSAAFVFLTGLLRAEPVAVGRQLRRRIVGTTAFVFFTFLLRAVFSIMNALANALQTKVFTCSNVCDPACNNEWSVILYWLVFTPEFQVTIVLISSPLAMLVALWGMTSKRALELMRPGRGQMVRS